MKTTIFRHLHFQCIKTNAFSIIDNLSKILVAKLTLIRKKSQLFPEFFSCFLFTIDCWKILNGKFPGHFFLKKWGWKSAILFKLWTFLISELYVFFRSKMKWRSQRDLAILMYDCMNNKFILRIKCIKSSTFRKIFFIFFRRFSFFWENFPFFEQNFPFFSKKFPFF